jgi:[acyl-carrier-protein] S-malonyltransferase
MAPACRSPLAIIARQAGGGPAREQRVKMSLAFVFPGQGSQSVGMLAELGAAEPVVQQTFDEASTVLGYDLWALCQQGPEAELGATERTQPAMLAAGVATWRVWVAHGGAKPVAMAGHSLGEYTALVCSGAVDFATAIDLVRYRGEVMQQAVPLGQGAMAAILGLDDAELEAACRAAAQGEVVEPVNFNAPGQTVIAGNAAAVARAIETARQRGAKRAVLLPVSVPSHSSLMRVPLSGLHCETGCRRVRLPNVDDVYTVDVRKHASLVEGIRQALKEQLFKPVRWADTVRAMLASGVTTLVECGPGKVLTSLNRRIERKPELRMLALEDTASMTAALAPRRSRAINLTGEFALVTGRRAASDVPLRSNWAARREDHRYRDDRGRRKCHRRLPAEAASPGRGVVLNVADGAAVDACFKAVEAHDGTPSILVNNAGITRDGLLMRMSADDWQAVLDTDLSSVYRTCKAVMRGHDEGAPWPDHQYRVGDRRHGQCGQSNYAAAKAGMIGFSKSLAREVGSRNITVNVVAPGFIVTDMTHALGEAQRKSLLAQVPLGRLGAPEDVAHAVAYPGIPGSGLHHR